MNAFTDDPKFTAYAFNELSAEEAMLYKNQLLKSGIKESDIEKEVDQLQLVQTKINDEFAKDDSVRLSYDKREKLLRGQQSFFTKLFANYGRVATLMVAVVLLITFKFKGVAEQELTGLTAGIFNKSDGWVDQLDQESKSSPTIAHEAQSESLSIGSGQRLAKRSQLKGVRAKKMLVPTSGTAFTLAPTPSRPSISREGYDHIEANDYVLVSAEPLSTFSIDVDTASYSNVRRFLDSGRMPPKSSIRIEELVNYFSYDYHMNFNDHPIAINVDQAKSPFHKGRKIVRVAMKAKTPKVRAHKNLVFLLDVSGSMRDTNKLPLLKESLKIAMRELKATDTISLVVYAGASGVVLTPTPVKEKLKIRQALNNLSAGGSTNGGAGIMAAYDLAKKAYKEGGVNRVILATDGDFNVGVSHRGGLVDLVKEKAKDNIFLTVLGFGMGNYQDAMLEEISNKGNGNFAYIDNLSEANKVFKYDLEKNMTTVAKDVKLQVEFNPKFVQAYRLIGYENRMLAAKDFNDDKKDAGEIGAGHTVTALYELIGHGEKVPLAKVDKLKYSKTNIKIDQVNNDSNELLNVKVRYKKPTGLFSTKFEKPLINKDLKDLSPDSEMTFAMSVAAWGLKLRGDDMAKNISYDDIKKMAAKSIGKDSLGMRSEFIELIDFSKNLSK